MDMNEFLVSALMQERQAEMQQAAQVAALRARTRQPLRVVIGRALVRIGNRLLTGFSPARAAA
jgi:hypothetical protein